MRKLPPDTRAHILNLLVEGVSIRATARLTKTSQDAVLKLLKDAGSACQKFHDEQVKGVTPARIECDEIWSFIHCKRKRVPEAKSPPPEAGDIWLFKAMDADSKLLISYRLCPHRGLEHTRPFMEDLRARTSPPHSPTIYTDGLHTFELGARLAFNINASLAQIIKPQKSRFANNQSPEDDLFLKPESGQQEKRAILGNPDMDRATTSHLESFNQTTRAALRRYTRKTAAHSKKAEYHAHAIHLYAVYYNWIRPHSTLGPLTTPAMASGLASSPFTWEGLIKYIDSQAPPPKPRGPYKPRKPKGPTQAERLGLLIEHPTPNL